MRWMAPQSPDSHQRSGEKPAAERALSHSRALLKYWPEAICVALGLSAMAATWWLDASLYK